MGFITLAQMREDLRSDLGVPGIAEARLTRAVNRGYMEVARRGRFKILLANDTFPTLSGTRTYAYPTRCMSVSFLVDTTNKRRLLQTSLPEIHLRDHQATTTSKPMRWAQDAAQIYLSPTPDGAYTLRRFFFQEPALLSAAGDVTVLANDTDAIVEAFARYFAFSGLGRMEEALVHQRIGDSLLGRIVDAFDRDFDEPGLYNTEVARSEADLTEWG